MNIIITGASRGIGFELVKILSKDPENQVLALSRNTASLAVLQDQNKGAKIDFLSFDLSQPDWNKLEGKIKEWNAVDIIINNAGLLINRPFEALSNNDWERSFSVNFFGPVQLIQKLLPFLKKAQPAHILNIGSMGGYQGSSKFPGLSAYSASKAALANLTETLAEELKEENIKVNCLALGAVQTEMLAEAFPGFQAPLTADKMGQFIVYFATQGRYFFNGKILPVSVSTP